MARVHVPQRGGEIAVARNADKPTVFKVGDDGTVTVPDADLETFLVTIEGSTVETKPVSPSKEQ